MSKLPRQNDISSSRMMYGWVSNFNPYILDSFDSVMMDGQVIEEAENMKRILRQTICNKAKQSKGGMITTFCVSNQFHQMCSPQETGSFILKLFSLSSHEGKATCQPKRSPLIYFFHVFLVCKVERREARINRLLLVSLSSSSKY